jgi:hypothetical protein
MPRSAARYIGGGGVRENDSMASPLHGAAWAGHAGSPRNRTFAARFHAIEWGDGAAASPARRVVRASA